MYHLRLLWARFSTRTETSRATKQELPFTSILVAAQGAGKTAVSNLAVEVRLHRGLPLGAANAPGLREPGAVFHRALVRFPALHLVYLVQLKMVKAYVCKAGRKIRRGETRVYKNTSSRFRKLVGIICCCCCSAPCCTAERRNEKRGGSFLLPRPLYKRTRYGVQGPTSFERYIQAESNASGRVTRRKAEGEDRLF